MKNDTSLSRRAFLGSGAALIALPILESLGQQRLACAAVANVATAPKRMVFLGMGFGVTKESWYPDATAVGEHYETPKVLQPLSKHKSDITIIQNVYHQYSSNGHAGSTFWLTGANQYAVPGQSFHNTISVDQVAAAHLGRETRFTSVQLSGSNLGTSSDGHGPGLSLAWNRQGKPVAAWQTPVVAYHRLFSDEKTPLAERQRQLAEQRSVLDTVLTDAKSVKRRINKTDSDKLDEYFQSVRAIEVRLAKEEKWLGVSKMKPKNRIAEPADSLEGVKEMRVMYDLMVDDPKTPLCNVWLSLLRGVGVKAESHGDSTGLINELCDA